MMKQKKYYVGTVTEKSSHTPISNVSVSDGRNVVKTDENGQFQLSGYSKTRFITMTSPSGYMTDQFYIDINQNLSSYDFTLEKSNISYGEDIPFYIFQILRSMKTVSANGKMTLSKIFRKTRLHF